MANRNSFLKRAVKPVKINAKGAVSPACMSEVMVFLAKNRQTDCPVSSGAYFSHDIHETPGSYHRQGGRFIDDYEMKGAGIDRICDAGVHVYSPAAAANRIWG